MYGKDHISNLTPAAFAAGFFFGRVTFLCVLHINLKRKIRKKIWVFKTYGILHVEKQKRNKKGGKNMPSVEEKVEEYFKKILDANRVRHYGKTEKMNPAIAGAA